VKRFGSRYGGGAAQEMGAKTKLMLRRVLRDVVIDTWLSNKVILRPEFFVKKRFQETFSFENKTEKKYTKFLRFSRYENTA